MSLGSDIGSDSATVYEVPFEYGVLNNLKVVGSVNIAENLTVDNNTLFVDSGNNMVGIGTTDLSHVLEVAVTGNSTPSIIRVESILSSNANAIQGIHLFKNIGSQFGWKIEGSGELDSTAKLDFISSQSGTNVTRMTIERNTGDVGIGTSSPTQKLDVNGSINVTGTGVYYGNGSGLTGIGAGSFNPDSINTTHILDGTIGNIDINANAINTTQIIDGTILDADISDSTNLTLGQKLIFTLGGFIQNIVSGQVDINGTLNVTNNLIVANFLLEGNEFNVTNEAGGINFNAADTTTNDTTGGDIDLTAGQGNTVASTDPSEGGNITIIGGKGGLSTGSGNTGGTGGKIFIKGGEGGGGQGHGFGGDAILSGGGDAPDEGTVKESGGGAAIVKGGDVLGNSSVNSGTSGTGGIANITGGRGGDGGGHENRNAGIGGKCFLYGRYWRGCSYKW